MAANLKELSIKVTENKEKLQNPLLKRLMEEVKIEEPKMSGDRYDRTHNRHNR